MINTQDLLKLLSSNNKKYTNKNVKISIKANGNFNSGGVKYLATIKDLSGNLIYSCDACMTSKKDLLFDDKELYKVEYEIEE
jgi:hypothetical protein